MAKHKDFRRDKEHREAVICAAKARAYEHNSKLRRPQGLEKPPRLDLHRGRKGKLR